METFLRSSSSWIASFISSENESSSTFNGFSSNEIDLISNNCSTTETDVEVHNFLNIVYNTNCISIQVDEDKFPQVANIINCNLTFIKSDETNGSIFKSADFQVTVTLYKSTYKIHVQGKESAKWLSVFLPLCDDTDNTDLKTVYRSSTPITGNNSVNLSIIDASLIESTSEVVLLKHEIQLLKQELNELKTNKSKQQSSVCCQTDSLQVSNSSCQTSSSTDVQQKEDLTEANVVSLISSSCQTHSATSSSDIGCQTVGKEGITDLELYIGLPKELYHRATRVVMAREFDQSKFLHLFKGDLELLMKTGNNPQDFKITLKVNDPDNRELPVPSTHGHGTAANMAKLFGIVGNGGMYNGRKLLSTEAITRFTRPVVAGYDVSFGMDAAWSVGTHLITMVTGDREPNQIFGHGGYGGQYAASDIRHKVGFAYTTPFLDPFSAYTQDGDQRMFSMFTALYDCIYAIENIKEPRLTFKYYSEFKKYEDEKQNQMKSRL